MTSAWIVACSARRESSNSTFLMTEIAPMLLFDSGAVAVREIAEQDSEQLRKRHLGGLIAGFRSKDDADRAALQVSSQLTDVVCEVLEETDHDAWVDLQRVGLSPTSVGPWTIRAPWDEPTSGHEVVIDPGAAFGHGGHPSTQLAIKLMLRALVDDADQQRTVLDFGTGTGVLAILAAKSGYEVRATEVNLEALSVARKNIQRNNVDGQVSLTHTDSLDIRVDVSDLVVANVTLDVHRRISSRYAKATRIIAAGLLCGQVAEMAELLPEHSAITISTHREWAAVDFSRPAQNSRYKQQ